MRVSNFFTASVLNIFDSKQNCARYDWKYILVVMQSTRYSCPILIKLELSRQIFLKSSNIKFHENSYSESRAVPYDETNSRFWQFCERA